MTATATATVIRSSVLTHKNSGRPFETLITRELYRTLISWIILGWEIRPTPRIIDY